MALTAVGVPSQAEALTQLMWNREFRNRGRLLRQATGSREPVDVERLQHQISALEILLDAMQLSLEEWMDGDSGKMLLNPSGPMADRQLDQDLVRQFNRNAPYVSRTLITAANIQPREIVNAALTLQIQDPERVALIQSLEATTELHRGFWHVVPLSTVRVHLLSE